MYVWGDDLVKSTVPFAKQMADEYERSGRLMIGVQEVPESEVGRYGIVAVDRDMRITDIIEKPETGQAPACLADFGRMVLDQNIIDVLRTTALGKGNELWIVDAIKQYIAQGGEFYALPVKDGEWLTTGDPLNYLKTVLKYALEREDIGGELREYLKNLEK